MAVKAQQSACVTHAKPGEAFPADYHGQEGRRKERESIVDGKI